jgi:GNAT superfamily N-acetyltransferase
MAKAEAAAPITIRAVEADASAVPALAALLVEAVADGASVGFMAGLDEREAATFWHAQCRPGVVILLAEDAQGLLAGTVTLALDTPPNQPHRADVRKMIVATGARRQGIGAALLAAAEAEARQRGRTTLVLDTITDTPAARLYERCGWQRVGEIAAYALMPDGTMAPTTYYARHL